MSQKKSINIGIRREDKNMWERRTPLIPEHIGEIIGKHNINVVVQPSLIRIFPDGEFQKNGAIIDDNLEKCDVILGIKEIPVESFIPGKTYLFFSHTIKGQKHNMPMLRKMMELGCTLIDYEKITDRQGKRLIFFGRHAGIAGMIDVLWAAGQRLKWEGISTPFEQIKTAINYGSVQEAKKAIINAGKEIAKNGFPDEISPFVCGFTGYGNVSTGAQEIFNLLPVIFVEPSEILSLKQKRSGKNLLYGVVFKEQDTVTPRNPSDKFDLHDYFNHPEKYISKFEKFVPYLTILVNCIYWDSRYPRLVTKKFIKELWSKNEKPSLRVIGDISCDIEGAIEITVKTTTPGNPVFVYNPETDSIIDGVEGNGPVVLAVDNLPCEISEESSRYFSKALFHFIPSIANENYQGDFEQCSLPDEIKKAVILWRGKLTPNYQYLSKFL